MYSKPRSEKSINFPILHDVKICLHRETLLRLIFFFFFFFYPYPIHQNTLVGTSLFKVHAIDADTSIAGVVQYSIDEVSFLNKLIH